MDYEIMGTKNKAVTAYLPPEIETRLAEYCLEHGLSRQGKKSGKEKPALGTGIIEVLRTFFGEDLNGNGNAVVDQMEIQKIVSKTLPENVPTEQWVKAEIDKAIAVLRAEFSAPPAIVPATETTGSPEASVPDAPGAIAEEAPGEDPATAPAKPTPLNQADLARRLNTNPSTLSRHQKKGEKHFQQWSQSKDPDRIPWQYGDTADNNKLFTPVITKP